MLSTASKAWHRTRMNNDETENADLRQMKCARECREGIVHAFQRSGRKWRFTAKRFKKVAVVSAAPTTGSGRILQCTLKWVPESLFLSSLQDEIRSEVTVVRLSATTANL